MKINSVKVHELHRNIIVVEDENRSQISYLAHQGVLEPGYVFQSIPPEQNYRVNFFVPLAPGSHPIVLEVVEP